MFSKFPDFKCILSVMIGKKGVKGGTNVLTLMVSSTQDQQKGCLLYPITMLNHMSVLAH